MIAPSAKPIFVIGDVMLDRYIHGRVERLSPEAPVPVLSVVEQQEVPGGSANVAMNCKALGAEVTLFGLVGQDTEAARLSDYLEAKGVVTQLRSTSVPTILKTRMIDRGRHLFRVDLEHRFAQADAAALAITAINMMRQAGSVVLSDYAKGTLDEPQVYISAARGAGLRICVDPKRVPFDCYRDANVLTPNALEFREATGVSVGSADFPAAAVALRKALSLDAILVTAGDRGMYLFEADVEVRHFSAKPVAAVDVTGAGDVVVAALADGLTRGLSLEDASRRANEAAASSVTQHGTGVVDATTLQA